MDLENIVEAINNDNINEPEVIGTFVDSMQNDNPVYGVEYDGVRVQFINSCNQRGLSDFSYIMPEIAEAMDGQEQEGEVYDGMSGNQIWWEVVDVDEKGNLLK